MNEEVKMKLISHDDYCYLEMNAPGANSMGPEFLSEMNKLIDEVRNTPLKPLILTGSGKIFSAGLELPKLIHFNRKEMKEFMENFENTMINLYSLERPVIAAVNGHAIAGGFVLMMQSDYRIGVKGDFKLGLLEAELGIGLPSSVTDTLTTQVTPDLIPSLCYEATLFNPEKCREMNIFHDITVSENLKTRAEALAKRIKIKSQAIAQIKIALRKSSLYNFQQNRDESLKKWLDTWFSDRAQTLVKSKINTLVR